MSVYISSLSLTTIAIDRLQAVTTTTTVYQPSIMDTMVKIATINTVSVVAILPYCAHMQVKYHNSFSSLLFHFSVDSDR